MSMPELTLDPTPVAEAVSLDDPATAAAAAVAEAPAEEAAPDISNSVETEKAEIDKLTPEEQAAVRAFAEKIDISNTEQVMNYGSNAQKNISDFSEAALSTVKTKDLGEVGDMLSDLVVQLKGINYDGKEKGIMGLFKKSKVSIESLKAQYDKAEVNVDKIADQLEQHEVTLLKDIALMDRMYEKNEEYLKELTMYIIAGKLKVDELRNNELVELQNKAKESGLAEDAQAANDFANLIGRFEKKIYDLELTRTISLQMSPQIRMIQNNDTLMSEKIRTSINNTIPLWKNQMVLALTMHHSEQAMAAQNEVTEVTNQLLKDNAEKLHTGSVAIAKEAERGIIDIETLQHTNEELIATLDEVRNIQDEGRSKREAAEKELVNIENQLKDRLLAMKG